MTKTRYDGIYTRVKAKGEKVFFARWKGKHGKQHNKKLGSAWGGMTLQEAVKLRAKYVLDENLGELSPNHVETENVSPTLDQCAEAYYKARNWDWKRTAYFKYTHRELGHIRVDDMKYQQMLDWWHNVQNVMNPRTKQPFAPKTINDRADELNRILKYARKTWEIGFTNYASSDKLKRNKVNNARDRYLTETEVKTLRKAISASTRKDKDLLLLFLNLAIFTGARVSTLINIQVKDIDLDRNRIKLKNKKVNDRTYNGFIHPSVRKELEEIVERCEPEQYVLSETYWPKTTNFFRQRLQGFFDTLFNTSTTERKHKVVLHTLRHTTASLLAIKGTPIHVIQKLLDHKDITMTMRYSHLAPSTGQDHINDLDI